MIQPGSYTGVIEINLVSVYPVLSSTLYCGESNWVKSVKLGGLYIWQYSPRVNIISGCIHPIFQLCFGEGRGIEVQKGCEGIISAHYPTLISTSLVPKVNSNHLKSLLPGVRLQLVN